MAGGALKIRYTGADASCLIIADSTGKTLTSKIGAAGAEAVDAAFGVDGVLDLTAAANDTLSELSAVIDAYADYTCEVFYGDNELDSEKVLDSESQAKGVDAYVLVSIDSVLASHALVSWEFAQEILELKDDEQTRFERLINAASATANRIGRRVFGATDYTVYLDGNGSQRLLLPEYPVNSITELNIDTEWDYAADTIETDYLLYADRGEIYRKYAEFPDHPQCVKAVFNAGYATVPDELQMAVIEVVAYNAARIANRGTLIGTKSFEADGAITTSYELTVPVNAQRVFEYYGQRM